MLVASGTAQSDPPAESFASVWTLVVPPGSAALRPLIPAINPLGNWLLGYTWRMEALDLLLGRARTASRSLAGADRDRALRSIAAALRAHRRQILQANAADVDRERSNGTPPSQLDRLCLDEQRLEQIVQGVEQVIALPDPLGRTLEGWRHPNGIRIEKVTVPFGVIGMIYESRPNVTVDAAVLCLKAGSSAVLRGSSSAVESNRALVQAMREGLRQARMPEDAVQLVDFGGREAVTRMLHARGRLDLIIPRGGAELIRHAVESSTVPVIETGVGNCHLYVHSDADLDMALRILLNGKCQRPGVCNALETLLVHEAAAAEFLPRASEKLLAAGVELRGDERTLALVPEAAPASEADWETEYLDLVLAVRVVESLDAALEHIRRYGTGHSEAIVTTSLDAARRFQQSVDAAAVFVNASTRFTDGFEFGFGAEIGISTQKLHARGPMGLREIVSYQYRITGEGQTR